MLFEISACTLIHDVSWYGLGLLERIRSDAVQANKQALLTIVVVPDATAAPEIAQTAKDDGIRFKMVMTSSK